MIDLPTSGSVPDDVYMSAATLAEITGYDVRHIYTLAKQSPAELPLAPKRKGIPVSKVRAWLQSRQAKQSARDAAVRRLRELCEAGAGKKAPVIRKKPKTRTLALAPVERT
jgi:hypothetical protein